MARNLWAAVTSIALLVLLVPASSLGYILPAQAILSKISARRAEIGFRTLVAKGTYQEGDQPPHPIWEAIRANEARRVEHDVDGEERVVLTVGAKRWRFDLGEPAGTPERVAHDLILEFVADTERDRGAERALAFCEKHGIDTEVVSLARQEGHIAYVIGAKPWESDKPQLWVDKRYHVPIRLVTKDARSGVVSEVRLLGFGSEITSEWYPRRIEHWENGVLVRSTTYSSVSLNEKLEPKLFAPPSS